MSELVLVTGGSRSGKSGIALEFVENRPGERLFLATSPMVDEEYDERISLHKREREGRGWQTVEEEINLIGVIDEKKDEIEVFLIDCLTLWVNNLLFHNNNELTLNQLSNECSKLIEKIKEYDGTVVMVTNEVGLGVVPESKLARLYRDLVGSCNQLMAKKADRVFLVSCGIPLQLK